MGARAHGRRREGRRIRKTRRQWREVEAAFAAFGKVAEGAAARIESFMATLANAAQGALVSNRLRREFLGGKLLIPEEGVPYPTREGVEGARGPFQGLSLERAWIDEIADIEGDRT